MEIEDEYAKYGTKTVINGHVAYSDLRDEIAAFRLKRRKRHKEGK